MNKVLLIISVGIFLLLNACDSGEKYATFDDKKTRSEYQSCLNTPNNRMSPAKGVACNNYEKGCLRRKKNGNNICAM